ncbi:MAG: glycosyltransferase, partial [Thermoproteota archaeon]
FFITKCLPHIIQTHRLTPYHIIVWPYLRNKIIDNIDGILASRSVYIEGCKYLNFNKCFYVGFGIDTEIFKPRNKIEVIKSILNNDYLQVIKNAQVFGDFYGLVNDILSYHDVTVIGYIGSTEPWWKNTTLLLNTFKNIAKSNDNIRLLIIGRHTKSLFPFLRNIPKDIIDRITIIERIPHKYIPLLYNLFDIFINPSLLDSLEINTLEALASGNITLASKKGCINDLKHLGINSIITFDPNEYSLTSTLEIVLSDINSYRDRALREVQQIHKQLSLETFGRRLIDAINFIKESEQQRV